MEFEFTSSIYVEESDLEEIATRVELGQDFSRVFEDVSMGWEDEDYYRADLIKDNVEKEIMKRIQER